MTRDFDLLDGSWYASQPFADFAWMRDNAPAYWDAKNEVWAITRHDDVLAVEKDPMTFSSHRAPRPHGQHLPMMISMDDPEHSRRRKLVSRGFTPRRVRDHEATIRRICTEIIDRVAAKGECDFVWDIAAPLPLLLIADMLGFPPESYDDLLRWSDDLIRATNADPPPAVTHAGMEAMLAFREFQLGVIADRRSTPRDDLVSILCDAEIDGERLDDESIIQESLLILIGGDETSRHVMTDGMLALLDHPEQLAILRERAGDDRRRRRGAAAVGVADQEHVTHRYGRRRDARPNAARRPTAHPHVSRGQPRPARVRGSRALRRAGATRTRTSRSASARTSAWARRSRRLELKVMFSELLRRLPDLHLAGESLPRRPSNFISGPEAMPVTFTPA